MTQRDRDKSVEQWLRQTPVPGARADDCLDAETLAAWAEGVLDGPRRSTAEAHASSCARCQAMLAVMVRTTPVAAASTGSPIRKWLMMLGPPLAAVTAVALWFAVGQEHRTPVLDSLGQEQAKAKVESAPSPAMPPTAPPVPIEVDRRVASPSSDLALESRERAAPQTLADARKERETLPDSAAAFARGASAKKSNEKKDLAADKRVDAVVGAVRTGADPVAGAPPPPPPPAASRPAESAQTAAGSRPVPSGVATAPPPQQANQAQNQAQNQAPNQNQVQTTAQSSAVQRQQQALEERVVVGDQRVAGAAKDSDAASRSGERGGGVAGGVADTTALSSRISQVRDFELAAAASTIRWRVVDGRTVVRSPDAGATWATQYTAPAGVFLTAGTAPSATVCWLVGRAGAILLSREGAGWQRVTFPEAIDLASVTASDARTATITTVDGRRFATADGGRTWTRP